MKKRQREKIAKKIRKDMRRQLDGPIPWNTYLIIENMVIEQRLRGKTTPFLITT